MQDGLLPQLQLAADVLDPGFGFRREDLRRATRGERERFGAAYQRLWLLSARSRLHSGGLSEEPDLGEELEELQVAELSAPPVDETIHEQLLRLALGLAQRSIAGADAAGSCPLCRFPTCDWASLEVLRPLETAISTDAEGWSINEGCCSHCAERYELNAGSWETTA